MESDECKEPGGEIPTMVTKTGLVHYRRMGKDRRHDEHEEDRDDEPGNDEVVKILILIKKRSSK